MKLKIPLLATLALATTAFSDEPAHPNIVVFLVDDMGVMDTSLPFLTDDSGDPKRYPLNDFYRTPNMERLAERGVRFNQFYAMSVCSPTRVSIMTGQNAARHRATNWINPWKNNAGPQGPEDWDWEGLTSEDITLPGQLEALGYRTIHVGKGHFGPEETDAADPSNLGFDVNIAGRSVGAPGSYYAEKNYGLGTKREKSAVPHLDEYHGSDTFLTEALTLEAKDVVAETVEDGQPFYLYFSHYAVHAPFESDPRFAGHYADSGKPEPAQAFATLIEGMDKSLGDMLDQLDELGIAENTLVFFLGDNGSDAPLGDQHEVACSAPLRGKKGAHYEGGMRVPFIAAWAATDPKNRWQKKLPIAAGAIQSQVADVTDLFPTLLGLVNAEVPGDHAVDGSPLDTLLTGKADSSRPEQFLMHYPHGPHRSNYFTVWRDGDWKVIHHALPEVPTTGGFIQSGGKRYELFNLGEDPFESRDLAEHEPEVLDRMIKALATQLETHDALHPVDEEGNELVPRVP
ncbi:MAG: sulfatase [Verrucomicrobiales bacterium]